MDYGIIYVILWIIDILTHIFEYCELLECFIYSFESYCVHSKSPRTYSQTDRQTDRPTDRQTDIQTDRQADRRKFFFTRFVFQDIQNMNIHQKERIFFLLLRLQYFSVESHPKNETIRVNTSRFTSNKI